MELRERLVRRAKSLISFLTTSKEDGQQHLCLEWITSEIKQYVPNLNVACFEGGGKPALLLSIGDQPPEILLYGHIDVVDGETSLFQSRISGNKLIGRGAGDMKAALAALMDIMIYEARPGLGLLVVTDEEVGGFRSTKHFLDCIDWNAKCVIMPDGGNDFHFVVEQKAVLQMKLVANGKSCHSAYPEQGENAILFWYRAMNAIIQAFPLSTDGWCTTVAPTILHAGLAANQVPGYAEGVLDIRYPATITQDDLLATLRELASPYHCTIQPLLCIPGFALTDTKLIQQVQETSMRVRQRHMPLLREPGSSDARHFAEKGIPVLIFQPECGEPHGPNEWVDLDSLVDFRHLSAELIEVLMDQTLPNQSVKAI